jgi:hypothetical protein
MTTTGGRFIATGEADEAVLKLKQLEAAKLVEVQDITVIRLVRSDLSVQEPDEVRTAVDSGAAARPQPPGNVPES